MEYNKRTLTHAEMEIMNILWDCEEGMTTHDIISNYINPKPAYSTIATFMKILTKKQFVYYKKLDIGGKSFYFYPIISREEYTNNFMDEVKGSFFGGSLKNLISFFVRQENISNDDLKEIMSLINDKR